MPRSNRPVVLITGVSGGIGLATAKLFAAKGWMVVGTIRKGSRSRELPAGVDVQAAEMARAGDLTRVVDHTWRAYGRIDALVCNAGYGLLGPIDTLTYAQMQDQFAVNTLAPAELIRLCVPLMKKQGNGVIIGISSVAGRTGLPGYSLYCASKHAMEGLFESLALELADRNIRLRLIEPSVVDTGFWEGLKRGARRDWKDSELGGRLSGEHKRIKHGLTAHDVAESILKAATSTNQRLRYPLGRTIFVAYGKRFLPDTLYRRVLRRVMM